MLDLTTATVLTKHYLQNICIGVHLVIKTNFDEVKPTDLNKCANIQST